MRLELVVANIPTGSIDPATTFRLQTLSSPPTAANPSHVLLRLKLVSVDPYLRQSLRSSPLDEPLSSNCVAEVLDSQLAGFSAGDLVIGNMPTPVERSCRCCRCRRCATGWMRCAA